MTLIHAIGVPREPADEREPACRTDRSQRSRKLTRAYPERSASYTQHCAQEPSTPRVRIDRSHLPMLAISMAPFAESRRGAVA
eukprot:329569-Chlamydomonas_euryale.AAC.3